MGSIDDVRFVDGVHCAAWFVTRCFWGVESQGPAIRNRMIVGVAFARPAENFLGHSEMRQVT
jgi:hypothetical protein